VPTLIVPGGLRDRALSKFHQNSKLLSNRLSHSYFQGLTCWASAKNCRKSKILVGNDREKGSNFQGYVFLGTLRAGGPPVKGDIYCKLHQLNSENPMKSSAIAQDAFSSIDLLLQGRLAQRSGSPKKSWQGTFLMTCESTMLL